MKFKELKNLPAAELQRQLSLLREQVRDLSFKLHSREVKNTHTMVSIKRQIAQILTLLKQ